MLISITRRSAMHTLVASGALASGLARAQSPWPAKPIRIIVPYTSGISADVVARMVAEPLGRLLGQAVVVENRPGASGIIGTQAVIRSAPDGYTMLLSTETIIGVLPQIYARPPFNAFTDLTPVAQVSRMPWYLVTGPNQPYENLTALLTQAKAKPDSISCGTLGVGSGSHVRMAMLNTAAKTAISAVPYSSTPIVDVMSGLLPFTFEPTASAIQLIKSGKVRALGITSATRDPVLPDVPTIAETLSGFEADGWLAFHMPAGTPDDILDRLSLAVLKVVKQPDFSAKLERFGAHAIGRPRKEFLTASKEEYTVWTKVIQANNIRAD